MLTMARSCFLILLFGGMACCFAAVSKKNKQAQGPSGAVGSNDHVHRRLGLGGDRRRRLDGLDICPEAMGCVSMYAGSGVSSSEAEALKNALKDNLTITVLGTGEFLESLDCAEGPLFHKVLLIQPAGLLSWLKSSATS